MVEVIKQGAYLVDGQIVWAEQPDLVILNLVHKQLTLSVVDAVRDHDPKIPIFWYLMCSFFIRDIRLSSISS